MGTNAALTSAQPYYSNPQNWLLQCTSITQTTCNVMMNGVQQTCAVGASYPVTGVGKLVLNYLIEQSNIRVSEVMMWNRILSIAEMTNVSSYWVNENGAFYHAANSVLAFQRPLDSVYKSEQHRLVASCWAAYRVWHHLVRVVKWRLP